jgi:hypothetical protein
MEFLSRFRFMKEKKDNVLKDVRLCKNFFLRGRKEVVWNGQLPACYVREHARQANWQAMHPNIMGQVSDHSAA